MVLDDLADERGVPRQEDVRRMTRTTNRSACSAGTTAMSFPSFAT